MRSSLQSRVLALVGIGVFIAGAGLSLLSRSTLLSLDREVARDHERLAASLAREVSRAVGHDLRLLTSVGGAAPEQLPDALKDVHRFGWLTSAAFVVDPAGQIVACEPAFECRTLLADVVGAAAAKAIAVQRPSTSNGVPQPDRRVRLLGFLPFRSFDGQPAGAAGMIVDPEDRRVVELLQAVDIAPTLRVALLDDTGRRLSPARPEEQATGGTTIAPVTGTPWQLQVSDVGPDPRAPIAAFRRQSLWLAPTLAAVAMLLGWGIARSVRQPLIRLTAAAERIARGNLERPIDVRRAARGGGEVARLAAALERMRDALRTSIGDIEEANRELERRVDARTRELAAANASLEERERVRQRLLRQVISAQEDERRRVARELHDETSQSLAALGIDLEMAMGGSGPEVQRRIDDARRIVSRMHQGLHRLIVNLRPSVLDDLGLAAAIQWVAERELAGLSVRCELTDMDERLPSEVETAVFRAVQESIVNIARHAQADSVLIQGSIDNGRLVVEIEDDGCGFDPAGIVRTHDSMRGIGLLGMRERVEILGGHVKVDSAPGEGTRVVLDVPVAPAGSAVAQV